MKIMDKNGRLFGKISIIDVVVVLVVLVMAVALSAKSGLQESTAPAEDQVITYQVKVNAIADYMAEALKVNDPVYEDGASTYGVVGKITDIQLSEGTRLASLPNGTLEMLPVEGTVDMVVTIEGRGVEKDGAFMINNVCALGLNSSRNFCTPYTQFTGTVVNIES